MAARSDANGVKKVFEYCEITWRIENYFLATSGDKWIIDSPEIYVKEPRTKWKMYLTPHPKDSKSMAIWLFRLECDTGPNSVWADFRMTLIGMKGKNELKEPIMKGKKSFVNDDYEMKSVSPATIEKRTAPPCGDKDTICIKFRLIVSQEKVDETYAKFNSDYDMTNLKHFIKENANKNDYDIVIKNRSKKIKAHKEVLISHSRYFENRIKPGVTCIELDLDRVELSKIIAYLYTHDPKHILLNPNLVSYDIIKKFKMIKVLEPYHSSSLIELRTAQNVQYDEFRWLIENVSSRTNGTILTSPILYNGSLKTCWKLELEIKVVKKSMSMSISAKPEIENTMNTSNEEADTSNEEADTSNEEADRITEEPDRITEETDRITEETDRITEEIDRITEETDRITEEADTSTEEADRIAEKADTSNKEDESHRILAYVEFYAMNSEGVVFPERTRKTGFIQEDLPFRSENFFKIEKSEIKSSLPSNKLIIIFRIQMLLNRRVSKRSKRKNQEMILQ